MNIKIIGVVLTISILISCNATKEENEEYYSSKLNWGFDYSGLRQQTLDTLLYFEDSEDIPGSHVGVAATTPPSYHTRMNFVQTITIEEADKLYSHPNPTIRGLAIEALFYQNDPDFGKKFIDSYDKDGRLIRKRTGCLGARYTDFEYFLHISRGPKIIYLDTIRFTKEDTHILDSLLMITDSAWTMREKMELGLIP